MPPSWTLQVEVVAYHLGAAGHVRMPSSAAFAGSQGPSSLKLKDINGDDTSWAPYGKLRWRPSAGKWSISLSSFGTSLGGSGAAQNTQRVGDMLITAGDQVDSDLKFINVDLEGGYRIYESAIGVSEKGKAKVSPHVDLTAGLRVIDVDFKLVDHLSPTALPGPGQRTESQYSHTFVQPTVGVAAGVEFFEEVTVDLRFNFGGVPGSARTASWDIEPSFTWRPDPNFGVEIGYRNLFMNLRSENSDSRFQYRGALAGIYLGVIGRF